MLRKQADCVWNKKQNKRRERVMNKVYCVYRNFSKNKDEMLLLCEHYKFMYDKCMTSGASRYVQLF